MTSRRPLSLSAFLYSFVRLLTARPCILILVLLATRYPLLATGPASVIANAPVKNFRLPAFDDSGNRTSLLRGGEARYISNTQIDIIDLNFARFLEGGSTDTEHILLAPSASVFIQKDKNVLLAGRESFRLISSNLEATGEDWTFDYEKNNRLTIGKNVRVIIRAELKGLLD